MQFQQLIELAIANELFDSAHLFAHMWLSFQPAQQQDTPKYYIALVKFKQGRYSTALGMTAESKTSQGKQLHCECLIKLNRHKEARQRAQKFKVAVDLPPQQDLKLKGLMSKAVLTNQATAYQAVLKECPYVLEALKGLFQVTDVKLSMLSLFQKKTVTAPNEKKRTRSGVTKAQPLAAPQQQFVQQTKENASSDQVPVGLVIALFQLMQAQAHYDLLTMTKILGQLNFSSYHTMVLQAWLCSELGQYEKAKFHYEVIQQTFDYELEDIAGAYSTVLWQLKDNVTLQYLVMLLTDNKEVPKTLDAPQQLLFAPPCTWMVLGNLYSAKGDLELAQLAFKHCATVSQDILSISQAYSLLGHEYMAADQINLAMASYKNALKANGKTFVALYSMSNILLKQERLPEADNYIKKALQVNPSNIVLRCHQAQIFCKQNMPDSALVEFDKAIQTATVLNIKNPLPMYKKASLLIQLSRYREAVPLLEQCISLVPQEAYLYQKVATCYQKLDQMEAAQANYSKAMSFNDKKSKELLENM